MAAALEELDDDDIQELNTFLNLRDPLKDSFMMNHKKDVADFRLDMKIHGPLINGILRNLYGAGGQGGGGRNPAVERKITEKFGANLFTEGPYQQYSALRFDANDLRIFTLSRKNLVIDTGSAITFGDNCKRVTGPFSIIDPGPRTLEGSTNLLQQDKTFSYTAGPSRFLRMESYITSIQYKHVDGTHPYQFTVTFTTGGQPQTFAYKRIRTQDNYCNAPIVNDSTNYSRNLYVKQAFDAHPILHGKNLAQVLASGIPNIGTFVDTLTFQLWWKLMGDSSFPIWIQDYIGTQGLTYENTLVASSDWGVIYRSLINGMACAHKNETNVTYYPIINGVLNREILERVVIPKKSILAMKRDSFKSLVQSNEAVLTAIEYCKAVMEDNPMFLLGSITEPGWIKYKDYANYRQQIIQGVMRDVCNTMIRYIRPIIESIRTRLEPLVAVDDGARGVDEFNEKVAQCMLDCPFIYAVAKGKKRKNRKEEFSVVRGAFTFLSEPFEGVGDELFNLDSIYTLYGIMDTSVDPQTNEWIHPTSAELISLINKTYNPRIFLGAVQAAEENDAEIVVEGEDEDEGEELELEDIENEENEENEENDENDEEYNVEVEEENENENENEGPTHKRGRHAQGGGGLSQELMVEYTDLLKNNRHLPNFLLWFVQRYIPEFFFIALAYDLALHPSQETINTYKPVFKHSILEKTLAPFGKVVNGYIEYDSVAKRASRSRSRSGSGSGSATRSVSAAAKLNRDSLVLHACGILKGTRDPERNILFKLSKETAPELVWCIETLGATAVPVPEKEKATLHSTAAWYYQKLYRADVRLCIQNKRKLQSPVDVLRLHETARATKRQPISESLAAKILRPFEAIRRKYHGPKRLRNLIQDKRSAHHAITLKKRGAPRHSTRRSAVRV
jgi:hypothetical protein